MGAQLDTHPSADDLRGFAVGKLDEMTAAVIMNHLDGCPDCCRAVAGLSGDDFLDRLRQAHRPSSTPVPAEPPAGAPRAPKPPHPYASPLRERRRGEGVADLPPELANNPQYEVLRELGRGGMGVVYLARNKLMDRLEVLKVVNKALLDRPGAVERFLREIRSAARLNHPNVVTAYSAVQSGELLAFAMEYVEGEDLAKLVQAQGPLPVVHACSYVQQAALALQHAFERKMVHRDIKPQNLMLAREGTRDIVKVLDFGLAKVTRATNEDTSLTDDRSMLGTPDYVAPEQTLDAANADIRADVYSLGCTLYYLLTGAAPFNGRSRYEVLQAHQLMEPRPLRLVRPEVPEELAAVVRKMMAKDPAQRYQTPMALVQALAAYVEQEPKGGVARRDEGGGLRDERGQGPHPSALLPHPFEAAPPVAADTLAASSTKSIGPRRGWTVGERRPLVVNPLSKRKWLIGGIAGAVVLFGLLGLWAGGAFRVKTPEGAVQPQPALTAAGTPVDEGRRAGEERDDNALKLKLCWCPTGPMPGFWIGKYEVTQSEWAGLMGSRPSHALDKGEGDRHPIYYVSHDEATEFCRKLTDLERNAGRLPKGWAYRLPTDEQWVYACRAVTTTATAFGDQLSSTQANFNGDWPHNEAPKGPNLQKAVEVGSYLPNAWGIHDMHGNVGEFTATPGLHRGGSWYDSGRNCCSEIFIAEPPSASEHVGFRVARVRN
jgi:serine/threonine protein kinase/formylglycine-generating enzyme required for sulfatase activity